MAFTPTDPTKAEVRITGTGPEYFFEFYIPRGAKGESGGFTLGVDFSGNLNALLVSGLYRNSTSAASTLGNNYPAGAAGTGCAIEVIERNAGSILQRVTPAYSGNGPTVFYERFSTSNAGASWSAWRAYASSRVDTTAGRAIYQWDDVNNREQLIYGDTGLRSVHLDQGWIDALTGPGVSLAASNLVRVRRVGAVVELSWAFDKPAGGTVTAPAGFPVGFRPVSFFNALAVTSSLGLTRAYNGGGGSALIYQGSVATLNCSGSLTYTTADSWPTTLPGTASGSIPNL